MDLLMMDEVARLKDQVSLLTGTFQRTTRVVGPNRPHMIKAKNASGSNLNLGDVVSTAGIDSTLGMLTYEKPTEDNARNVLGVVAHYTVAGEVGYVFVTGVCPVNFTFDYTPAAGMPLGTQEDSTIAKIGKWGVGYFHAKFNDDMCLASIDRTERILVDHRDTPHTESSGVYELVEDTVTVGQTSDVLKVVQHSKKGPCASIAFVRGVYGGVNHNHGWCWGVSIEEGDTGGNLGWGPLSDIIGIRDHEGGESHLDIKTIAQFNDGKRTMPVLFDGSITPVFGAGPYVMGKMVPDQDGINWIPAVPVDYDIKSVNVYPVYLVDDCQDPDQCRLLVNPIRYQKHGNVTGPILPSVSNSDNYLQWIACNRWDINGIFRALWYVSCIFSWRVGNIDSQLQTWLGQNQVIDQWMVLVIAMFACLNNLHGGACNTPLTALQNFHSSLSTPFSVWYSSVCGQGPAGSGGADLPELQDCPMHEQV